METTDGGVLAMTDMTEPIDINFLISGQTIIYNLVYKDSMSKSSI